MSRVPPHFEAGDARSQPAPCHLESFLKHGHDVRREARGRRLAQVILVVAGGGVWRVCGWGRVVVWCGVGGLGWWCLSCFDAGIVPLGLAGPDSMMAASSPAGVLTVPSWRRKHRCVSRRAKNLSET